MSEQNQISMFEALGVEEEWRKEWQGMPEYQGLDNKPYHSLIVNFKTKEDYKKFAELILQNLTSKTDTIWFPKQNNPTGFYVDE